MPKSNNIFIPHHQNEAKNHNTQTASNPTQHFGMTRTNRKIHLYRNYEGIKCGNCLLSFCSLSFCLLVWAAVSYGSETWSLTLRAHRLWREKTGWSQDGMTLSGRKREEDRKKLHKKKLHDWYSAQGILFEWSNVQGMQPMSSNNECVNSFVLNAWWEQTISETKAWTRRWSQNGSNTAWTTLNCPMTEYRGKVLWPHTHTHTHTQIS